MRTTYEQARRIRQEAAKGPLHRHEGGGALCGAKGTIRFGLAADSRYTCDDCDAAAKIHARRLKRPVPRDSIVLPNE